LRLHPNRSYHPCGLEPLRQTEDRREEDRTPERSRQISRGSDHGNAKTRASPTGTLHRRPADYWG
ncbi:unnamed protein product, partial [Amoebophrya sp. A120]